MKLLMTVGTTFLVIKNLIILTYTDKFSILLKFIWQKTHFAVSIAPPHVITSSTGAPILVNVV